MLPSHTAWYPRPRAKLAATAPEVNVVRLEEYHRLPAAAVHAAPVLRSVHRIGAVQRRQIVTARVLARQVQAVLEDAALPTGCAVGQAHKLRAWNGA